VAVVHDASQDLGCAAHPGRAIWRRGRTWSAGVGMDARHRGDAAADHGAQTIGERRLHRHQNGTASSAPDAPS
jgi:hypothetical protein